jgi:hypothetical protein
LKLETKNVVVSNGKGNHEGELDRCT